MTESLTLKKWISASKMEYQKKTISSWVLLSKDIWCPQNIIAVFANQALSP